MQQVGRYQIVGELGRGAMGVVYRALDPAIGRTVAVKTIRLRDLSDEAERGRLRDRLFREAQTAGVLSHPNIVTIYDIAESDGMAYIFMEFVDGPPLEKMLMEEQPPDKESLLTIFRQTATALDHAHKRGIVHRDIKPANLMVCLDGTAKITDFGVAKIMSQQMTQAGTMMGTPNYMSPEQIQGGTITGRADQFALAVIVYEILTGEKPFVADHLPTLLFKILRDEPTPPQRLNTTLAPQVEPVLRKALAKMAEDRYETCTEFISALSTACLANPQWMPLPRGASHDLPTVATSTRKFSTTMQETIATSDSTPAAMEETVVFEAVPEPQPEPEPAPVAEEIAAAAVASAIPTAAPETPPVWQPQREAPPSNTFRNLALAAILIAAAGGGLYWSMRSPDVAAPAETSIADVSPDPAAVAPAPTPTIPTPPPPVAKAAATTAAETKAVPAAPAATPTAKSAPKSTEFALLTTPAGAVAVFDNDLQTSCTTPCVVKLPPGRHTYTVRNEGYRQEQRIVQIPDAKSANLDLALLAGTLNLTTNPSGLTVMIDGKQQGGKTPLNVVLPAGKHRVQVLRGTERQEISVDITDGVMTTQSINWQ